MPLKSIVFVIAAFGIFAVAAQADAAAYSAANVLGQANFTSSGRATAQSGMNRPNAVAYDSTNKRLFVADFGNNRVLVYDLNTISDGEAAVNVLGQANFTSSTTATTQSGMNQPQGLAYDATNQRLYVAEQNNNRVVMFDVASISDGENAALVLGQANFTSSGSATTQSRMFTPGGVLYDSANDRLYVAEGDNHRVLVFNSASSLTDGANASNVLGQANFTSSAADTSATGMNRPLSLALDATNNRLFVSEGNVARVMVFNVAAISNGEAAVNVLGQPDLDTSENGITQSRFDESLVGLAYDSSANYLFVSSSGENRVMIFDVTAISNGENGVNVLGQANFTSSAAATSQTGLNFFQQGSDMIPQIPAYDAVDNRLFVPDFDNSRVMVYNFVKISDSSYPSGTLNSAYSQSITTTASQGTVSSVVASGALPTGLSISSGSIAGTPSAAGDYTFTLRATDAFDTGNFLYTSGNYTITIASAGGGARPPLSFEEQRQRLASRFAPAAPNSIRVSSPSCTSERCPVELRFTYTPLALHRSRATRFVFYDDRNRPITSLTALPAGIEEYRLTILVNGANSAISGRLCAVVGTQESCAPVQGFADIVLDPDTFAWSDELLDVAREEYRLSFRTAKLPANYSVGKTKATIAVYEDSETRRVIVERAVTFAPQVQVLVPAMHAGSYIVRITPQNAAGKAGAAVERRIIVPLLRVAEKPTAPFEGVNEAIREALSRLGELLRALLQLLRE